LPAITFMGLAGTTLLATVQSSLADHHGHFRALALTEANVVASGTTILAPLLVGSFARLSFGWRGALIVPAGAWLLMFLLMRDQPVPAPLERDDGDSRWNSLPRLFWFYWLALLLGVAVEWSIITWGGDFLVEAGPLTRANASLVMSAFFVAMLIGRFLGAVLARRVALAPLLLAAMVTGLVGFLIFWLVPLIGVRLGGLFLAGLGVANLFPLLLSIAMGIAGPASDLASARITLGTGSAILLAPLTLGWIADRSGISAAYLLVALFFGVMITVALVTRGFERRNLQPL
jgi:MFS family permease